MYNSQNIANQIKSIAKSKKIPLRKMLSECGLGINLISHLSGGQEISYLSLAKIADYLNCSIDLLLGRNILQGSDLTETEKLIITAYRENPDMQSAVHRLLNIDE